MRSPFKSNKCILNYVELPASRFYRPVLSRLTKRLYLFRIIDFFFTLPLFEFQSFTLSLFLSLFLSNLPNMMKIECNCSLQRRKVYVMPFFFWINIFMNVDISLGFFSVRCKFVGIISVSAKNWHDKFTNSVDIFLTHFFFNK